MGGAGRDVWTTKRRRKHRLHWRQIGGGFVPRKNKRSRTKGRLLGNMRLLLVRRWRGERRLEYLLSRRALDLPLSRAPAPTPPRNKLDVCLIGPAVRVVGPSCQTRELEGSLFYLQG